MAASSRNRLRRPLPLVITGEIGTTVGSILWMDGVDVVVMAPLELPSGTSHHGGLDLGDAGVAEIEIRVLDSRQISTESGPAWLHDGVYRPANPADGSRIEKRLTELGVATAAKPHRSRRRTLNPLSQVGSRSHSQSHSRRESSSNGDPLPSSVGGEPANGNSEPDAWTPDNDLVPLQDLEDDLEFPPLPDPEPPPDISATPPRVPRPTSSPTEYVIGRHVDQSLSRPPEEFTSPPFSGSPLDAMDSSPDLRARLTDRARAAALAHARRRLADTESREAAREPRRLADRSPVPRPAPTSTGKPSLGDEPSREAIRAGQLIRSTSQSGGPIPDAPRVRDGYQRPGVVVAPGSPASVQLVLQSSEDLGACVVASGDGVVIHVPAHPDIQDDEQLVLMVVQLPSGAYLQFDAQVVESGPLMLVLDATEAPAGRIGPLLTALRLVHPH